MNCAFEPELCTFGIIFFCGSMRITTVVVHMVTRSVRTKIINHIIVSVQFGHQHFIHIAQAFVGVILPDHSPAGTRRCCSVRLTQNVRRDNVSGNLIILSNDPQITIHKSASIGRQSWKERQFHAAGMQFKQQPDHRQNDQLQDVCKIALLIKNNAICHSGCTKKNTILDEDKQDRDDRIHSLTFFH